MSLQDVANTTISPVKNTAVLCFEDGKTQDIVTVVLEWHKRYSKEVCRFAPHLQGNNIYETCRNIWFFLKGNIRYKKDPDGMQWIKSPARVWADKSCDCKSYAVFIASVLTCLKIPCNFRFVSFEKGDPKPTHVYIVVPYNGKEIIIDDVMPSFNEEAPYTYKTDYMTQIIGMNGIPGTRRNNIRRKARVSGFGGTLGLNDNNISGGLSTALNAGARQKVLNDALPDLVMLALYMYIPAGPDGAGGYREVHDIFASDKNYLQLCPAGVAKKRELAFASFWNFGDWAGIKVEVELFPKIKTLIAAKLGMDPMQWWIKKFNDAGIYGTPTSVPVAPKTGSLVNTLSAAVPYLSFVTSALSVVGKLFGGSDIQWKYGPPEQWAPAASDWNSFKFNPLIAVDVAYSAPGTTTPTTTSKPVLQTGIPVLDTAINTPIFNAPVTPQLTFLHFGGADWNDSRISVYKNAAGALVNVNNVPVDESGNVLQPGAAIIPAGNAGNPQTSSMNIGLTVALAAGVVAALMFGKKKSS